MNLESKQSQNNLQISNKLKLLERENSDLKKTLIFQQRKFYSLASSVQEAMNQVENAQKQLKKSEKGQLILENEQLHKTVKDLAHEIETLTTVNQQILEDQQTRSFFDKYQNVCKNLNELQSQQDALVEYM